MSHYVSRLLSLSVVPLRWRHDRIPHLLVRIEGEIQDIIAIIRVENDAFDYGGRPAQSVFLVCSEHLQPWQCLGMLHVAHEQTRRMM